MLRRGLEAEKISFNALVALSLGIHSAVFVAVGLQGGRIMRQPLIQVINVDIKSFDTPEKSVQFRDKAVLPARPAKVQTTVQAKSSAVPSANPAKPLQQAETLLPKKEAEMPLPVQGKNALSPAKSVAATPPPAATAQPKAAIQQTAPTPARAAVDTRSISIAREYTALIRSLIDQQKDYPVMARKIGAEGTVYIRFALSRDGRLKRAEISRSSGRSILDKAAINAITSINRFPPVPDSMEGVELYFELPVAYKLSGH